MLLIDTIQKSQIDAMVHNTGILTRIAYENTKCTRDGPHVHSTRLSFLVDSYIYYGLELGIKIIR